MEPDARRPAAALLPFHGKSLPPIGESWWSKPYRLEGAFLRSVPLALSAALELDRPTFMGCSVGGLLALDLALRHPDRFRAVISVEGALHAPGSTSAVCEFWHPRVNSEYKARVMNGLMSPTSPEPYRKETSQVYASGWPPVFLGDLHSSATLEAGREAHEAIVGSTFAERPGLGHFPMSEDPTKFFEFLLPILDRIRKAD